MDAKLPTGKQFYIRFHLLHSHAKLDTIQVLLIFLSRDDNYVVLSLVCDDNAQHDFTWPDIVQTDYIHHRTHILLAA